MATIFRGPGTVGVTYVDDSAGVSQSGKSGTGAGTSFMFKDPYEGKSDSEIFQMITQEALSKGTSAPKVNSSVRAPVILKEQSVASSAEGASLDSTLGDEFQSVLDQGLQLVQDVGQSVAPAQKISDYDRSEYLRKQAAAQVENALAGLKGAYSKSMAEYDAALDLLPQRYQGYRNDAAAQAAIAQKNFDERSTASGLNSGASGQAALDASAVYRGTLGQLDQAQANAAAEIDRAKADLRAQYETAVAQAKASGDASLAQAIYQELIRGDSLAREDRRDALAQQNWQSEFDFNKEQTAKNWEYTYQQDQKADALNSAALLAGQGRFEALGACYNWDDETVQYMTEQYWIAKNEAKNDEAKREAQHMADGIIQTGHVPDAELLERAGYTLQYAQLLSEAYARFNAGQYQ